MGTEDELDEWARRMLEAPCPFQEVQELDNVEDHGRRQMTRDEAIAVLCSIAAQWAENTEEQWGARISAVDTDDDLREAVAVSQHSDDFEVAKEVREVRQAIAALMNSQI